MKIRKRFLSILLSLALVLGLISGMSMTAQAAEESESISTAQPLPSYSGEHFTITCDAGQYGFNLTSGLKATIKANNNEVITKVEDFFLQGQLQREGGEYPEAGKQAEGFSRRRGGETDLEEL